MDNPFRFNDDMIIMPLQAATQWDALSHVYYDDQLYNGFPADSVTSLGAYHCGIDKVDSKGITSRGVLLDLVRHRGAEVFLRTRQPDHPGELDDAARSQGVTLEPGDIVLVRTGWWTRFLQTGNKAEPGAGLDWRCASWLHDHEVAAVAADNLLVENPVSGVDGVVPAHAHAVPARHGADARRVLGSHRAGRRLRGRRCLRVPAHRTAAEIHRCRGLSGQPDRDQMIQVQRRTVVVDGLATSFLEAGDGDPVVLLHGGEFGAERRTRLGAQHPALAGRYRVLAPDMLGFGDSAKVVDFIDGRGMRIRHVARFCEVLGVDSAHFVGNSMGAINLLTDPTSDAAAAAGAQPWPSSAAAERSRRTATSTALNEYDATLQAMRRVVEALFFDPGYPADEDYVRRRYESSIAPGAWEALAAARFRRPGCPSPADAVEYARAMSASTCRSWWSRAAGDKLLPGRVGRRDRQADHRCALRGRRRRRPLPADRAAPPSTTCCWISSTARRSRSQKT